MKKSIQILLATTVILFTGCEKVIYEIPEHRKSEAAAWVSEEDEKRNSAETNTVQRQAQELFGYPIAIYKFGNPTEYIERPPVISADTTAHEIPRDTIKQIVKEYMSQNPVNVGGGNKNDIMFLENRIRELEEQVKKLKESKNDEWSL